MRKWALAFMVFIMAAAPMLACGFPLPAGTEMMQVSKSICAEGEPVESCQARQDAYQLMSKLQSAAVPDLEMALAIDTGNPAEAVSATVKGSFEYVLVPDATEGLGANIHARIDEGELISADGTQSLDNIEFIIVGNKGYTSRDNGQTWVYEELTQDALLGLGMLLGLSGTTGTGLDLFSDPAIFDVTTGEAMDYEGQTLAVQTLTVDLNGLLGSPAALTAMMDEGFAAAGDELGVSEDTLGMTTEEFASMAGLLGMFIQGSDFSTTIGIGPDGYIHYVNDNFLFTMDMSSVDPEAGSMTLSYVLSGHITQHNEPLTVTEPTGATEGEGLLGEGGILGGGSGGLGESLFGG